MSDEEFVSNKKKRNSTTEYVSNQKRLIDSAVRAYFDQPREMDAYDDSDSDSGDEEEEEEDVKVKLEIHDLTASDSQDATSKSAPTVDGFAFGPKERAILRSPTAWLNENVIILYLKAICHDNKDVYLFDPLLFYMLGKKPPRDHVPNMILSRKWNYKSQTYTVIPVNINSNHWGALVIDSKLKMCHYFDSMMETTNLNRLHRRTMDILKLFGDGAGESYSFYTYTTKTQNDTHSCGLYCIANTAMFLKIAPSCKDEYEIADYMCLVDIVQLGEHQSKTAFFRTRIGEKIDEYVKTENMKTTTTTTTRAPSSKEPKQKRQTVATSDVENEENEKTLKLYVT